MSPSLIFSSYGRRLLQIVQRAHQVALVLADLLWISTTQFAICWLMRASAFALRSSCKVMD
jgi:hypothetical protein